MKSATATKRKIIATQTPYRRTIDLGNGVMFPVDNEREADLVEWLIEEAKAGRVSLPTKAPGTYTIPARPVTATLRGTAGARWTPLCFRPTPPR